MYVSTRRYVSVSVLHVFPSSTRSPGRCWCCCATPESREEKRADRRRSSVVLELVSGFSRSWLWLAVLADSIRQCIGDVTRRVCLGSPNYSDDYRIYDFVRLRSFSTNRFSSITKLYIYSCFRILRV
ncbi:hypothetical protein U1Q18_051935 [Sarracenia purpurea var. burkii]